MSSSAENILYIGHNIQLVKTMLNLSDSVQSNYCISHQNHIAKIETTLTEKKYSHFICELPLSSKLIDKIAIDFPLLKTTYLPPINSSETSDLFAVKDGLGRDEVRNLLDELTIPISFKNNKGEYVACNRYFLQQLGLTSAQVVGKKTADVLPDQLAEKIARRVFTDQNIYFHEYKWINNAGEERDLVYRTERVANGAIKINMIFDVTEVRDVKRLLEKNQLMLRTMANISPDLIFFKDLEGRFLGCNKQFEEFAGCPEDHILGKKDDQLFELTQAEICQLQDRQVISSKQTYLGEEYLTYSNGDRHLVEMKKVPLQDHAGEIQGLIAVGRDITLHHQAQRRLKIADSVFENSKENIIVTDEAGDIISVNKACCVISGFTKSELSHANINIFASNQYTAIQDALGANNSWQGDASWRMKNGDIQFVWIEAYIIEHANDGIRNYIYYITNSNQSTSYEEKIHFLSKHDPLTGLFNRISLFTRLEDAITRAIYKEVCMAVILVDINGFKAINDQYDHNTGDEVIKEIATRLKSCVFEKDTVARFGDDEFVIIVDELDSEQDGAIVAQKIAAQFKRKFSIENIEVNLSATIGISICPDDGTDIDTLLGNAEKAMQRGKKDKSAPYHFYTRALTRFSNQQLKLEEELKEALLLDQFELYYQPQYDLNKRQIVAVEGLLRWDHPIYGIQHPDDFLILAEHSGLLPAIVLQMLRKAAEQAVSWHKLKINFGRIAINLSEVLLSKISFVIDLQTILLETKCASLFLEFEIDEAIFSSCCSIVHENLAHISKLGIALTITNYAAVRPALDQVNRLQIEKFKISKRWIQSLPGDHVSQAMIDTLLVLANSLGMDVVGDGIDNAQQESSSSDKNFSSGQGKFIAKEMKASEATFYLRCNKRK